jgi:transcriptional regulator with PAS, ATPase and Fis domain
LIAATNQNLEKLISAGRFREDFYYRLEHAIIHIPPLRERREDILLLVECFLQKFNQSTGKSALLSDEAKELLRHYHWPGNIRELSNKIEHAVVFCPNSILLPKDFDLSMRREALLSEVIKNGGNLLEEMERRLIAMMLEEVNYNFTQASTMLGIGRNTLKRKMEAYKLGRNEGIPNG